MALESASAAAATVSNPDEFPGKANTNEKNVYNNAFFDIYCYCQKPHTYESIDKYMVQCF